MTFKKCEVCGELIYARSDKLISFHESCWKWQVRILIVIGVILGFLIGLSIGWAR